LADYCQFNKRMTPIIPFTAINRRVYTFRKQPDSYQLEPLYQGMLNIIQQNSPLNRYTLIHLCAERLETKQDIQQVVSRQTKLLLALGCIQVEEYKDWKERLEREKDAKINAMIVPSSMGGRGFSIKIGNEPAYGHYTSVEAAREHLRTTYAELAHAD
jgi:hypothetical protein